MDGVDTTRHEACELFGAANIVQQRGIIATLNGERVNFLLLTTNQSFLREKSNDQRQI